MLHRLTRETIDSEAALRALMVDVDAAYTQCSKAFLRSHLWDSARFVERDTLPSNGEIHQLIQGESFDGAKYDEERAARYARREGFY